jgi:hypothetical protein
MTMQETNQITRAGDKRCVAVITKFLQLPEDDQRYLEGYIDAILKLGGTLREEKAS